jgi:hypothetical protein
MSKPVTPSLFASVHAEARAFPTFPDDRTSSVYYRTRRGHIQLRERTASVCRDFCEGLIGTALHGCRDERWVVGHSTSRRYVTRLRRRALRTCSPLEWSGQNESFILECGCRGDPCGPPRYVRSDAQYDNNHHSG